MLEKKEKPRKPYFKMNREEWLKHGRKNKYDKLSRTELKKKCDNFYKAGMKEGHMKYLIPNCKTRSSKWAAMDEKELLMYGVKEKYHKMERTQLAHKDPSYYEALRRRRLIGRLIFKKIVPSTKNGRSSIEKQFDSQELELFEGKI